MNLPAFFVDAISGVSERARLDREESHHAIAVLRLRAGAELLLLDGKGTLARARLLGADASGAEYEVLARDTQPPRSPRIHVASAPPKGERQNVLLDMATQLGMASYTPLACARGVAAATAGSYARWDRVCRSACKQALVRHRPELRAPAAPADFVRGLSAAGAVVFLADLAGAAPAPSAPPVTALGLVVGPEGGFTDAERSALIAAGARPLRLASGVLRVETAVVAGLAILQRP